RCTDLVDITIGNNVLYIGNHAFANCFNLTEITIPDSVINIGEGAFEGCRNLSMISIPHHFDENDVQHWFNRRYFRCYIDRRK
ncbi:MAG: leucine-rich repeat domain-containing protein, partial [Lentisphaeria bacterium]|nr:leucine-rich repeat domain-containing protein [Lentisphaeria bacterium]